MDFITLERLDHTDIPAVQAVLDATADAGPPSAGALFRNVPRGAKSTSKRILGICRPSTCELIGLLDVIIGYPTIDAITVGRVALVPSAREARIAARIVALLEVWAESRGARSIRAIVHEASIDALRAWVEAGYDAAGAPLRAAGRLMVVVEKRLLSSNPSALSPDLAYAIGAARDGVDETY